MSVSIGELSKRSGFSKFTIRYYESIGLLGDVKRTESGYRIYTDDDQQQLYFIALAKSCGFTLNEIKSLVKISRQEPDREAMLYDKISKITTNRIQEVTMKIKKLSTIKEMLSSIASNPAYLYEQSRYDDFAILLEPFDIKQISLNNPLQVN